MIRSLFAVIAGFVLWSALWLGYNALLTTLGILPAASANPVQAPMPLLLLLAGSILFSLAAGYATTALVRTPGYRHTLVLGVLLLGIGILVQAQFWQLMPLWYHLCFLVLLLPATGLGGTLRQRTGRQLAQKSV
jgi:hypothetical protein